MTYKQISSPNHTILNAIIDLYYSDENYTCMSKLKFYINYMFLPKDIVNDILFSIHDEIKSDYKPQFIYDQYASYLEHLPKFKTKLITLNPEIEFYDSIYKQKNSHINNTTAIKNQLKQFNSLLKLIYSPN